MSFLAVLFTFDLCNKAPLAMNYKAANWRVIETSANSIDFLQQRVCMWNIDVIHFYYWFEMRSFHQTLDLFCLSRIVQAHWKETKRIYLENFNRKTQFCSNCTREYSNSIVGLFIVRKFVGLPPQSWLVPFTVCWQCITRRYWGFLSKYWALCIELLCLLIKWYLYC